MRFYSVFHTFLTLCCYAVSFVLVVGSLSNDFYAPYGTIAIIGSAVLGYFLPSIGCSAALILAPLAGNRPGTTQAFFATLVCAALFVGIAARTAFDKQRALHTIREGELRNPLLFLGLLYTFFSLLSLVSVPVTHFIDDLRNATSHEGLQALAFSVFSLFHTNEHSLLYSGLSVYYTTLAYLCGIAIFRLCQEDTSRRPALFVGSIFVGLMVSLAIGVLDYYGTISLTSLRGLDPIVNPEGKQFRLQSFFGHSGWFAEYLTLTIPTCLVVLSLRLPFWARVVAILFALALGEFALILTYQRGGWLSYPLTLFAVWAAIYVVRLLEKQQADLGGAFRRSLVKVLISLPATVMASLALVVLLQGRSSVEGAISPYVARFKDIQRTGDRTEFFHAGVLIGSLHPILGGGSDSFAWQFEREFESPKGTFSGKIVLPLHGSAHNVYAQTFAGKGACGLLALVAIPLCLLLLTPGILKDATLPISTKLTVLTGACCGCAFLIYGNVQEIFYIQVLQFLFFAIVAIVASVTHHPSTNKSRGVLIPPWLCVSIVCAQLVWEFAIPGRTREFYTEKRVFGCYAQEVTDSGSSYRWCGERGRFEVLARPEENSVRMMVEAGPLAQDLSLFVDDRTVTSVSLLPGEKKVVVVPVSPVSQSEGRAAISFVASSSFVPKLTWPTSGDTRRLSFKLSSLP